MEYQEFLQRKVQLSGMYGFKPDFLPDELFDFQKYLIDWALMKGRGAIFSDTGTGKTLMQLVWAKNIVRKTNKNVIIFAPLAVSAQTMKEGEKFGIEVKRSRDGYPAGKITITNYEQIEKFNSSDYIAAVLDESSYIKNAIGKRKKQVVRFLNKMPYRSLWTATAAPNDYPELGSSSEALGELPYMEMISQFFRDTSNDKNPQWCEPKYVLKEHARDKYWQWVCSWARAMKMPSDLGFSDEGFVLPTLHENDYVLEVFKPLPGELFVKVANTLSEQRNERKITVKERSKKVMELVHPYKYSVVWCEYNYEADYLSKIIKDAVEISGKDSLDKKEDKLIDFGNGNIKTLITKAKIGAFGLNWQHCNHSVFYPSHSYEQRYQAIRRFYRFGQKQEVFIDTVTTEGEKRVLKNQQRKAMQAEEMFKSVVHFMNNELLIKGHIQNNTPITVPSWL